MAQVISNANIKVLARKISNLILENNENEIVKELKFLLEAKCPFPKLDLLGKEIGQGGKKRPQKFFKAFAEIINSEAMGGFVIVSTGLICFLGDSFEEVMQKSRAYIIKGNKRNFYGMITAGSEEALEWQFIFLVKES